MADQNASVTRIVQIHDAPLEVVVVESDYICKDITGKRERLHKEGILIVDDLLPRKEVVEAQKQILDHLEPYLETSCELRTKKKLTSKPSLLREPKVSQIAAVHNILEHPNLVNLISQLLDGEVVTTTYKWLRAVSPGDYTGLHIDRVYMGNGSQKLLTAWIPFVPVSTRNGGLIWLPKSHTDKVVREKIRDYIECPIGNDGTSSGWLQTHPGELGEPWHTHDFEIGSVAIFGLDLLHQTIPNKSEEFRITCDTRWQPLNDKVDPRVKHIRKPIFLKEFVNLEA